MLSEQAVRPSKPQTPDFESSSDEDEEEENNPPLHHKQNHSNKTSEDIVKKSPVPKNIAGKEAKPKDPPNVLSNSKNLGKDKAPANLSDSISSRTRRKNTSMNTSKQ